MMLLQILIATTVIIFSTAEYDSSVKTQQAIGGSFDGCYSDTYNSLTANGNYHQRFSQNSNSMCLKICKDKGFAVAATKGADCYCSNSLPVPSLYQAGKKMSSGNGGPCSTVCPGAYVSDQCRGDECCGGPNAYSVYIVDSIDILKELINRIATNFKNDRTTLHKQILSASEIAALNCQCFNGEVTIYLTAKSLSSDGTSSIRTVKSVIDIANYHTVEEVTDDVQDLRKVELVAESIEKLLETEEPIQETPFGKWDLLCDNYFGGADLSCSKSFSESAEFSETFSITHGIDVGVSFSLGVEVSALAVTSLKTFEASFGYSWTYGYSETITDTMTDGFDISLSAKPGTKAEVRFFKSDIPVKVKWRVNFFADGDVLIDFGDGVGINKTLHLSRLLSYDQRKLFAFGTIDYGERPTIIARTRTVDREGNIVSEKEDVGTNAI